MPEVALVTLHAATADDKRSAAPLLYDCAPHLFSHLTQGDYDLAIEHFELQWSSPKGYFPHTCATIARAHDVLVGLELGMDAQEHDENRAAGERNARAFFNDVQYQHLQLEVVQYLAFLFPPIPDDAYYVQNLATTPEVRGRGVGRVLLENAFDQAKHKGYSSCHLDVVHTNPAVRFYQRMGMRVVSESRVTQLEKAGIPPHYRMVMEL